MDILSREILKDVALDEVAPKPRRPKSPVDHWSTAVLLERAAYLRKMARVGDGSAAETLRDYPRHAAVLSFQARSGEAEVDEKHAVLLCILAGNATLVAGGALVGARAVGAGEVRGQAVEGGVRQELRAGDVVHIPAGTPHQLHVAGEKSVTCLTIRIQEDV
ncbi:MAG: cupin domain-containing protein [Terracidiphilus sp.]